MEIALIVCLGWILSVCLHEWGHAAVAYAGGDTSVKDKGYLTLNIFKYTDPGLSLFFPILVLALGGIALPGAAVYIDHRKLRNRAWQSAVAAAGPGMSLLTLLLVASPFSLHFAGSLSPKVAAALAFLSLLQAFSIVLNSFPMPGFDGYGVIDPWLPQSIRNRANAFGRYGIWLMFALLWAVPAVSEYFFDISTAIVAVLGVNLRYVAFGYRDFHQHSTYLVFLLVAVLFLMNRNKNQQAPLSRSELAEAMKLYGDARKLFQQNRPADALAIVDKSIQLNGNLPEAWHLRGLACALMNRGQDAIDSFDRALILNPNYTDCWYNKACCLALHGYREQALLNLQKAIELNPEQIKEHAAKDVGFKHLWQDDEFKQLVGKPNLGTTGGGSLS